MAGNIVTRNIRRAGDWLGLTDTEAGERAVDALDTGTQQNLKDLRGGFDTVNNMWDSLSQSGGALDNYNTGTGGSINRIANSGVNPNSAQDWLNPQLAMMQHDAAQAVAGNMGASAGSSAANNAIAQQVARIGANEWNNASNRAFANSQNEQNIGRTTADVYNTQYQNNLQPTLGKIGNELDYAGTAYQAGQNVTQGRSNVAGQDQSMNWLTPALKIGGLFL